MTRDLANLLLSAALVLLIYTRHPFALGVALSLVVAAIVAELWR